MGSSSVGSGLVPSQVMRLCRGACLWGWLWLVRNQDQAWDQVRLVAYLAIGDCILCFVIEEGYICRAGDFRCTR